MLEVYKLKHPLTVVMAGGLRSPITSSVDHPSGKLAEPAHSAPVRGPRHPPAGTPPGLAGGGLAGRGLAGGQNSWPSHVPPKSFAPGGAGFGAWGGFAGGHCCRPSHGPKSHPLPVVGSQTGAPGLVAGGLFVVGAEPGADCGADPGALEGGRTDPGAGAGPGVTTDVVGVLGRGLLAVVVGVVVGVFDW
jgi:hypothetical protein